MKFLFYSETKYHISLMKFSNKMCFTLTNHLKNLDPLFDCFEKVNTSSYDGRNMVC